MLTDKEIDLISTLRRYVDARIRTERDQALKGELTKSRSTWGDLERIVKGQPLEGWDEYVKPLL